MFTNCKQCGRQFRGGTHYRLEQRAEVNVGQCEGGPLLESCIADGGLFCSKQCLRAYVAPTLAEILGAEEPR